MARGEIQIHVRPGKVVFIERRGGRANRGGGEFSRREVLDRLLDTLRNLLEHYDPLKTGGLSSEIGKVAIRLLEDDPWKLKALEIEQLEKVLERAPDFRDALAEAGIEPVEFLRAIQALTFGEKVSLVDRAIQEHSPRASAATPQEP
jgi:hypothetical protein